MSAERHDLAENAALHDARNYKNAISAFEEILLKMSRSSDPHIRRESIEVRQLKWAVGEWFHVMYRYR